MYAPIIIFAYNRPEHLEKTLSALAVNNGAKESELFIFIDGPKNQQGILKTKEVEAVAYRYLEGYFKYVHIQVSDKNKGLAKAVIAGVTEIINKYGKVIVTEDDSVPAPSYLDFMNKALNFFENDTQIWSIGGYTVPLNLPDDYFSDIILTQRSSSYAWATWQSRWNKIDWEVKDYKRFHWNFSSRRKFNQWGDDRASMLDDQMLGRVNSWAIRFDYAMFKSGMYNILPSRSLIQNIGHDGSGTHSVVDARQNDVFCVDLKESESSFEFQQIKVDERIRQEFCKPFGCSRIGLAKRFLGNLMRSFLVGD